MKKTISFLSLLFGLFVCVTVFSACGGDDDNGGSSSNPLVGTWRAEVMTKGKLQYWDLTFTSDYKFACKETYADTGEVRDERTGTYSVDKNVVTINAEGFGTSAFQINGNELTFSKWDYGKVYKKIK